MTESTLQEEVQLARIAVYDDLLSSPRIIDIQPQGIKEYLEEIASKTYEFSSSLGGKIPYSVIRQVAENFIHAHFKEPVVSIFNNGNTIRFADQGPGISNKTHAQLPGFSSATKEMKEFINGVGSGLPIVKEYLSFSNGRLVIEDNIDAGTVITITIENVQKQEPIIYQEKTEVTISQKNFPHLSENEKNILLLSAELGTIGPTDVETNLGISLATGYRALNKLEEKGLLEQTSSRKRKITEDGLEYLDKGY